jgi:hypothetical protein
MLQNGNALSWILTVCACTVTPFVASAPSQNEGFFRLEVSNGGRASYLQGEKVLVEVWFSNPGDKPLTLALHRAFSGLEIDLVRDGEKVFPTPGGKPFGDLDPSKRLAFPVHRERKQGGQYPLTRQFGVLAPGKYTVRARYSQTEEDLRGANPYPGLVARDQVLPVTTGTAVSNQVRFTVRAWEPKAVAEKEVQRVVDGQRSIVQLVETSEGELLVAWKSAKSRAGEAPELVVVPTGVKASVRGVFWDATDEKCHVLYPTGEGEKKALLVVDKKAPSSVSLPLAEATLQQPKGAMVFVPLAALISFVGIAVIGWLRLRRRSRMSPTAD